MMPRFRLNDFNPCNGVEIHDNGMMNEELHNARLLAMTLPNVRVKALHGHNT